MCYNQRSKSLREAQFMYQDLTVKQVNIIEFIVEEVNKKGYPPSVREICKAVGLKSTSSVHNHLVTLQKLGYIKRDATKTRAIELNDQKLNIQGKGKEGVVMVPVVGSVAAGTPILAVENIDFHFPIPEQFSKDGTYFMLRISGDSMIEAGIHDQDYVLVKQKHDAENGDMVVALLDDSATVKTFYREKDHIRLQPENSSMNPIIVTDDLMVLGQIKGVFRFM